MDYLYFTALVVLFIQGASTLLNKKLSDHAREFGAMTMIFSVILVVVYWKFVAGPLVLSREFGYLIAEDLSGKYWLLALIFTFCILFSFAWRISREFAGQVVTIPKFLIGGIVVGLMSVFFVGEVESAFADELPLYTYDLWWPPLLIWSAACFTGSAVSLIGWSCPATIKGYKIDLVQPCCIATVITLLSFFAFAERNGGTAGTLFTWQLIIFISSAMALLLAVYLSWDPKKHWRRRIIYILSFLLSIAIPINAIANPAKLYINLLLWLLALMLALLPLLIHAVKQIPAYLATLNDSKYDTLKFAYKLLIASLIVSVAFSLTALFLNLGRIDTSVLVTLGIISWVVLIDIIWKNGVITSALSALGKTYHDPKKFFVLPRTIYRIAVNDILKPLLGVLEKFFIAEKWYGTLFKSILSILVLVAISEIPNAGRTIIMPVKISSAVGDPELGDQITDRTVYELKRLAQQLTHEVALVNPSGARWELYGRESGVAEKSLAESGSIELPGGVKLPLHILLWPVQKPMRWLLDVNVVQGSLVKVEAGYGLIATSSQGNSWYIEVPLADASDNRQRTAEQAGEQNPQAAPEQTEAKKVAKAIPDIAKQLAFNIVASGESAELPGIPKLWEAYQHYARGLEALNNYLLYDKRAYRYENLKQAISDFHEAIKIDPSSESAYYRLGLALQEDVQSYRALEAYENSLKLNPNFIPAKVALAYIKTYPPDFELSLPPGTNILNTPKNDIGRLWGSVIDDPGSSQEDLASAYSVLANLELDQIKSNGANDPTEALAGYFFARQAISHYGTLHRNTGPSLEGAQFESFALNLMGVILDQVQGEWTFVDNGLYWLCARGSLTEPLTQWLVGPYIKDAANYYRKAIDKYADDNVIQCNYAESAIRLGDERPMLRLQNLADARRHAGDLIQPVDIDSLLLKLDEYRQAINFDPSDNLSRNSFAYAYYVYRSDYEIPDDPNWQLLDLGLEAEAHIREAVRLGTISSDPSLIIYRSTLGEVLLAMQRFAEAKEVLEGVTIPSHAALYEIKWDLAQVYSCLGEINNDEAHRSKAQQLLTEIRINDLTRDVPLYKSDHSILDVSFTRNYCVLDDDYSLFSDTGLSLDYQLAEPVYDSFKPCDRNVVEVVVDEPENFAIRTWGNGGINDYRIVPLDTKTAYTVVSWEPQDTDGAFYTRLYWNYADPGNVSGHDYRPVSSVVKLTTYADCARNRTKVHFVKSNANTLAESDEFDQ